LVELGAFLEMAALLHGLFAGVAGIWERYLEQQKSISIPAPICRQAGLLWTARNESIQSISVS
jgi:hypothetical protein